MEIKKVITIAEIGINHNGDIKNAKKLIDFAALSGFDYVKFQKRNPKVSVPEGQKYNIKQTPWGNMTYIDYKNKIEFGRKEYNEINLYCKKRNIGWFASAWDIDSVKFLSHYRTNFLGKRSKVIKIPSAHLTNDELLKFARKKSDVLLLSTGMSTERQIERAVRLGKPDIIFHTNSTYPSPMNELNLNYIKFLKKKYKTKIIGYSGHEFGLTTTIASIYLGAQVIERHVTLDRTMWGSDQMASVEPHGMIKLIKGIRELEDALGEEEPRQVKESELKKMKSLRK